MKNNNNLDQRLRTNIEDRKLFTELLKKYLYYKLGEKEDDSSGYYIYIFSFYFKEGKFIISYEQGGEESEYFIVQDYDELLKFIENPDLFKEQEKYNL